MKSFIVTLLLILIGIACQKKEQTDPSSALAVLSSLVDNGNGTVTDSLGKVWLKCTYGQVWDSSTNLCIGTGGGTTYGAKSLEACSIAGFCYNPETLSLDSGAAFSACDKLSYGGFTDWRLPTRYELAGLAQSLVNRDIFLISFPNTPDDKFFWTVNVSEIDQKLAYTVNFSTSDFGKEFTRTTTTVQYVRCIRP